MGSSEERAARNEALFRDINDQIEEVSRSQQSAWFDALCECSDSSCTMTIPIQADEYEAVRARGTQFALVAGHEVTAIERVVERSDRFVVVEKLGEGARIADALDPRAP